MRIVSQDGTIDVPYENTVIVVTNNYIGAESHGTRYAMAAYSSEELADKAMENLHKAYRKNEEFFDTPIFQFPCEAEL